MGKNRLTHNQVISKLLETNAHYKNGEFRVLSKFRNWQTPLIVKDKYGYHKMNAASLLKGAKPSARSSMFPLNYLSARLCGMYRHFYRKEVVLVGPYERGTDRILVRDIFGICKCSIPSLLSGSKPTILSALDKTTYFINKSKKLYGDRFTYERTVYGSSGDDVIFITCPKHGDFETTPNVHIQNHQCSKCSIECRSTCLTTEEFIYRAKKVHGEKYDYSLTNYETSHQDTDIVCPVHGVFRQRPNNHLNGSGCKACSEQYVVGSLKWWCSLCHGKRGTLYVLKCYNNEEVFIKLGITCKGIKERYRKKTLMPYDYDIISSIESDNLRLLYLVEASCKSKLKSYKYTPKIGFGGSRTESFIHSESGYWIKEVKFKDIESLVQTVLNELQLLEIIADEGEASK